MKTIHLNEKNEDLELRMQYHPFCSKVFREINGSWKDGKWIFPITFKEEVKDALVKYFGEDGENAPERVKVQIKGNIDPYLFIDANFNVCFLGQIIFRLKLDKKDKKNPEKGVLIPSKNFKVYGLKTDQCENDWEIFKNITRCNAFEFQGVSKILAEELSQINDKENLGLKINIIQN